MFNLILFVYVGLHVEQTKSYIYRVLTADKVKLNCYMLLRVSCISNHQTYIMFILPKKIKPKSFDTIKLQIQEIIILNKIDNP